MVGRKPRSQAKAERLERLRHAGWAGLIALALNLVTLFEPIDQLLWITQSRIAPEEASGDIVFIGANEDLADPAHPQRREDLAELIDRLDSAGARAVYVDVVFERSSEPEADAALNDQLRQFGGETYLVQNLVTEFDGEIVLNASVPAVASDVAPVGSVLWQNFLNFTWSVPYEIEHEGRTLHNIAVSMARTEVVPGEIFPVSYNFALESIPTLDFDQALRDHHAPEGLIGKTVVIGNRNVPDSRARNIPGQIRVPTSIVNIYAAETLRADHTTYVSSLAVALAVLFAMLLGALIRPRYWRYAAYSVVVLAIPVALYFTAMASIRMGAADALALLVTLAIFRARSNWKAKLRLVDGDTGLPTFGALEADKQVAETVPAIIVAKIHRFEEVRRTLPAELHAEYVLRIIGRLRAATQDATIYLGQGHMIAWTMREKEPALLKEHLEGLRALFASPLQVGDSPVDVGITFGVDITPSPNVSRRLAAAVAVAEKTTETFEPIAIADTTSDEDLIWNISLQSRIDAALANDEIYLVYQPKIMVQTGEVIGVEALVRWRDPVRGHIPPDHFVRQCENAGRMSHLTRFVLERACAAGNYFEDQGLNLPVAVNISATLLHERGIVRMVSEVLEQTGFEPRRLTLEITETYRISNLDRAAEILGELHDLGTKISMDDFGVGAASLEALLRLPFSELKIDRLFISRMTIDPKAKGIVRSIFELGKDLRIIIVAEGVEDAATLTLLRDLGCNVAQGYGISRPVEFGKILELEKVKGEGLIRNMV